MLSSELEFCLNEAFRGARDERHEFITVEHLLLALLDSPEVVGILRACGGNLERLRRELADFIDESTPRLRGGGRRVRRLAADAWFPAGAASRGVPRAIRRQDGSDAGKRAGRGIRGTAVPCGLPARIPGDNPSGCGQTHLPRSPRGSRRRVWRQEGGRRVGWRGRGSASEPAGSIYDQPQPVGAGRRHRPVDRPGSRGRADDPDSLPAAQEQPAVRGRGRGRQDGHGGGGWRGSSSRNGCRKC